jgi:hypothetical protein
MAPAAVGAGAGLQLLPLLLPLLLQLLPPAASHAQVGSVGAGPVVETSGGVVQGVYEPVAGLPVAAFRGIPYGAPPVGRLGRFKPPQPAAPWTGVLNASVNAPACFQMGLAEPAQSEDCLALNVFSPNVTKRGADAVRGAPHASSAVRQRALSVPGRPGPRALQLEGLRLVRVLRVRAWG